MKYPKSIMRLSELQKLGYPREMLLTAYRTRGQTFAQKCNPLCENSPIIFETEKFEKWRLEQQKMENKAIMRG